MDLDAVSDLHPDLKTLIDYWRARKPADAVAPALHDIELMDIYRIAPRLVIVDIETGGDGTERYRWRFAGSDLRNFVGIELTGRYLWDTADEPTARETAHIYADIAAHGGHHYWERSLGLRDADRTFLTYKRLLLPLTGTDGRIVHFLGLYILPKPAHDNDQILPEKSDLLP